MSTSTRSRIFRIIGYVTKIWAELDHAQRRLLEIRTDVKLTRREPPRTSIDELEALYAHEEPE